MVCEFSPCEAMHAETGFEYSNAMRHSRRTNGSNGFLDELFRVEFDRSLCDYTAHCDCGDAPCSGQLEQRGTENSSRLAGDCTTVPQVLLPLHVAEQRQQDSPRRNVCDARNSNNCNSHKCQSCDGGPKQIIRTKCCLLFYPCFLVTVTV
jgi:hypothetical protein